MKKEGYDDTYAAAVTAASSIIGPMIPPSIILIIYAYIMKVPVGGLFAAGIVPGLLVGLGLMLVNHWISTKRDYPKRDQMASCREITVSFLKAIPALLLPIIIFGGIVSGVFTPTEAAAVAAVYALVLSMFFLRTMRLEDLTKAFLNAVVSSSTILLLIGTATFLGWVASISQTPAHLAQNLLQITHDPYLLLFLINVALLLAGMILDNTPAILILGPIFAPTMEHLGVDPLHFAIIMCVNLTVGLVTPPMGLVLFVTSSISKIKVETIAREMLPFLVVEILVIFLVTYVPAISMTIPRLMGF